MRARHAAAASGRGRVRRWVARPAPIAILAAVAAVGAPSVAQAVTPQSFTTPGTSIYTVPADVTQLTIAAVGAAGGPWCTNGGGGRGAVVSGMFPVTPGEQLTVSVGGVGAVGPGQGCGGTGAGGVGGGGSADTFAGGGGGASGVSTGTGAATPTSELIVGGGGGGQGAGGGAGGDAGAEGSTPVAAFAAEPGTDTAGGAGGIEFPSIQGPGAGADGAFGAGGAGGSGYFANAGGGGGGGGYYGGGGGAGNFPPAGGGAGGSSYLAPEATMTSGPSLTSDPASVTITDGPGPAASLSAGSLNLGSEPAGSVGPAQTETVNNQGSSALEIAGAQPGGAHPGDYLIADGCVAAVPPGGSCQLSVRFAPAAQGQSSATLTLVSNSSSTLAINVSGTGTPAVTGTTGPTGPRGARGPAGPRGATRPAATIVCRNTAAARSQCTLEFAPETVSAGSRFVIRSGQHVVRAGSLPGTKRETIVHRGLGRLPPGRYTFAVITGSGRRARTLLRLEFRVR